MRTLISFLHPGFVWGRFTESLLATIDLCADTDTILATQPIGCHWNIPEARNKIVEGFLKSDYDRLLFLDYDMVWRAEQMKAWLERHEQTPIVSGLYVTVRLPEVIPIVQRVEGAWSTDELRGEIPVQIVPAGCLLLQRSALEQIGHDWFTVPDAVNTEDVWFSRRARDAGLRLIVDCDFQLEHLKPYAFGVDDA